MQSGWELFNLSPLAYEAIDNKKVISEKKGNKRPISRWLHFHRIRKNVS